MENNVTKKGTEKPVDVDGKIDVRDEICPVNFVKIKLKLEKMEDGQILRAILDDGKPMSSVPGSIKEEGHQIIHVEKFEDGYKIYIKKSGN